MTPNEVRRLLAATIRPLALGLAATRDARIDGRIDRDEELGYALEVASGESDGKGEGR